MEGGSADRHGSLHDCSLGALVARRSRGQGLCIPEASPSLSQYPCAPRFQAPQTLTWPGNEWSDGCGVTGVAFNTQSLAS